MFVIALVMTANGVALAQPAAPPRASWDQHGWVLLGEREVRGHGKLEHDRIAVGRQEGRFSKLTVVVEDSELELVAVTVRFGKGDPWTPMVNHFFREGQRTRVIEFPESAWGSSERSINAIDFAYRNVPGEGHARVQVWAWRAETAVPPPPPAPTWDARGWVLLGDTKVHGHGKLERDRIQIGPQDGRFTKVTVVVEDSDLEMIDFIVGFNRGRQWHPSVSHYFREGQRTRVIELPENEWGESTRAMRMIEFAYRNIPGEGHAHVLVYGWRVGEQEAPPPAPPPAPTWDSRGWVMLGELIVHGHGQREHDRIEVGRQEGKFRQLTVLVDNSDLEMIDFTISFKHGDPWRPGVSHYFREGQRTRLIQLPESESGRTERVIQAIDFWYRNVPGEGHARVQVWAQ